MLSEVVVSMTAIDNEKVVSIGGNHLSFLIRFCLLLLHMPTDGIGTKRLYS